VAQAEAEWYVSRAATDGVPLDIRHGYTKADWEMWTAAWLKDHHEIRDLLIAGLYTFGRHHRPAGSDDRLVRHGYDRQNGFQARPWWAASSPILTVSSSS